MSSTQKTKKKQTVPTEKSGKAFMFINNLLSFQSIFLFIWGSYFLIQGFDLYANWKCFYGGDRLADFIKWGNHIKITNGTVHLLAAHFSHLMLILLGIVISIMFVVRPIAITMNEGKLQYALEKIEGIIVTSICVLFTINSFFDVLFAERTSLWRHGAYLHMTILANVFFFSHVKNAMYFWVIVHWSLFHLMNGLDIFHFFGKKREDKFEGYFKKICMPREVALTALYSIKVYELLVGIFGFIVLGLSCVRLIPSSYLKKHGRQIKNKVADIGLKALPIFIKLTILLFIVFLFGDQAFYDNMEVWEHLEYTFQVVVMCVLHLENERCKRPYLESPFARTTDDDEDTDTPELKESLLSKNDDEKDEKVLEA